MASTPKYTPGFRQRAVEPYRKSDTAYAEVARAGRRPRLAFQLDEAGGPEGGGRSQVTGPVPDGGGPAQTEKGKRAAEARERDPFKSQRLLRGQGPVRKAKLESIAAFSRRYPVSEPCSAPKVTGQGYCARRKSAASERAPRDAGLAAKIFDAYEASRRLKMLK